jgi:hypothetical protein
LSGCDPGPCVSLTPPGDDDCAAAATHACTRPSPTHPTGVRVATRPPRPPRPPRPSLVVRGHARWLTAAVTSRPARRSAAHTSHSYTTTRRRWQTFGGAASTLTPTAVMFRATLHASPDPCVSLSIRHLSLFGPICPPDAEAKALSHQAPAEPWRCVGDLQGHHQDEAEVALAVPQ